MTSSTAKLDQILSEATREGPWKGLPTVVVMAADENKTIYSNATGNAKFPGKNDSSFAAERISPDYLVDLWSCTKLVTAIAALQMMEAQKFTMKTHVAKFFPEVLNMKILKGFDDAGEAILVECKTPITIEMLLTHSSGFSYGYGSTDDLKKYCVKHKIPFIYGSPKFQKQDLFRIPLAHQPGEGWMYGVGLEIMGLIVEKVSGFSLEGYFQRYIFQPLGITDMSFNNKRTRAYQTTDPENGADYESRLGFSFQHAWGGAALIGSPKSFLCILQALLRGGEGLDGAKILSEDSVDQLFAPRIQSPQVVKQLGKSTFAFGDPFTRRGGKPLKTQNFGFGGLIGGSDLASGRKKGSLTWFGYGNNYWVIDRTTGVAFLLFYNFFPHGAEKVFQNWLKVEPLIYEAVGSVPPKLLSKL